MINDIILKAKEYAVHKHRSVNQLYSGYLPYEFHLQMAVDVANRYINGIPDNKDALISAVWLHDTIEDTRTTYDDLVKEFGINIADIVYAVTNEKGRTRAERANDKYYRHIRHTEGAAFVKLCDRIANVQWGIISGGSMLEKYRKEQFNFGQQLYPKDCDPVLEWMFYDLDTLLNEEHSVLKSWFMPRF